MLKKVLITLITIFIVISCASSDDPIFLSPADASTGFGSCDQLFCPKTNTSAKSCCVSANGPCGQDFGNGCISFSKQDAN